MTYYILGAVIATIALIASFVIKPDEQIHHH
jgi:hypothetical protein